MMVKANGEKLVVLITLVVVEVAVVVVVVVVVRYDQHYIYDPSQPVILPLILI